MPADIHTHVSIFDVYELGVCPKILLPVAVSFSFFFHLCFFNFFQPLLYLVIEAGERQGHQVGLV